MNDKTTTVSFWNVPNILTLLRIVAIPFVAMMLWEEPTPSECIIACILFAIAMITDVIDGYLARKWNQFTPMGAYLDPLADKLMVTTILIMLIPLGWAPAWVVAILLCREITITGLRGIASQENLTIVASPLGKTKTAFQSVAIGMLLWHHPLNFPLIGLVDPHVAGIIMLYISLFFALFSGAEYFVLYYKTSQKNAQASSTPSS
jgi:CDP-diacylglycerol--glycerol-3-phosphate 3-phosphatidyltransferase